MARPRTPKAKAEVIGQADKQKTKFNKRKEPVVNDDIGEPFDWLKPFAKQAWKDMVSEIPWLNSSHRTHLGIAATIRGRMMGDSNEEVGVQALNLLRQCLGQMGATPADATKVTLPNNDEEDEDDLDD